MIERRIDSSTVFNWESMAAQQSDMQKCMAALPGFVGTAVSSVFQIGEAASMLSPKFKKIWETLKSEITGPAEEAAPAEEAVPTRKRRRRRNRRHWNKVVKPVEEAAPAEESVTVSDMATVPVDKIKLANEEDQKTIERAESIARTLSGYKFYVFDELRAAMTEVDSKLTRQELENILREKVNETVERFAYRLATMPATREEQMAYLKK